MRKFISLRRLPHSTESIVFMKKYNWHKIADVKEELAWQTNGMMQIEVSGKKVCLIRGKDITACAANCPHASGILADGYLDPLGNIVCPVHRYKFNPHNGRNVSGEGYFLKTYPIESRSDGIYIGFEEGGIFSWLK